MFAWNTYFLNSEPTDCPMTIEVLASDCVGPAKRVQLNSGDQIEYNPNELTGYEESVCFKASTSAKTLTYNAKVIQASACGSAVTKVVGAPVSKTLVYNKDTTELTTIATGTDFFTSSDPSTCGLQRCVLLKPGCAGAYSDPEVTSDGNNFQAYVNKVYGFEESYCVECTYGAAGFHRMTQDNFKVTSPN